MKNPILFIILIQLFFSIKVYAEESKQIFNNNLTINIFNSEFINTRNLNDFIRSLKRIEEKKIIKIHEKDYSNIFLELSIENKEKYKDLIKRISSEAFKKSLGKKNYFYKLLKLTLDDVNKIHHLAYYEIKLVDELRKSNFDHTQQNSYNNSYFNYLINHVRYEILINFIINYQNVNPDKSITE